MTLDLATITCHECGANYDVPIPSLELTNNQSVSAIVWAHPEWSSCPACGLVVCPAIGAFDPSTVKMAYLPMPNMPRRPLAPHRLRIIRPS